MLCFPLEGPPLGSSPPSPWLGPCHLTTLTAKESGKLHIFSQVHCQAKQNQNPVNREEWGGEQMWLGSQQRAEQHGSELTIPRRSLDPKQKETLSFTEILQARCLSLHILNVSLRASLKVKRTNVFLPVGENKGLVFGAKTALRAGGFCFSTTVISQRRKLRYREAGGLPRVTGVSTREGFKLQHSPQPQDPSLRPEAAGSLSRVGAGDVQGSQEEAGLAFMVTALGRHPSPPQAPAPLLVLVSLGLSASLFSELRAWPWEGLSLLL